MSRALLEVVAHKGVPLSKKRCAALLVSYGRASRTYGGSAMPNC